MVLCALKSCGIAVMRRPTSFSVSIGTPVSPRRASSSAKPIFGPAAVEPVGLVGLVAVGRGQLLVEMGAELGLQALDVLPR